MNSINTFLRVVGIAFFIISVQGIIRGVLPWFSSKEFNFKFILPFIPDQYAFLSYLIILIVGLVLVSVTKKFDDE